MSEHTLSGQPTIPAEDLEVYPRLYEMSRGEFARIYDLGAAAMVGEADSIPVGDDTSVATIRLTDGETPGEIVVIGTNPENFGDILTHSEIARRFSPEPLKLNGENGTEKQTLEYPPKLESVAVNVGAETKKESDKPEGYRLQKEELPALLNELEGLNRVPDVTVDPAAARWHDEVVGTSMGDILRGLRNGDISKDSAILRMARNVGAAINNDFMSSIITEMKNTFADDDLRRQLYRKLDGLIDHESYTISADAVVGQLDSIVISAQRQGHTKIAQLINALAIGASYKIPNKQLAQQLREKATNSLLASFEDPRSQ